jgi:hypothetical protein
MGQPFTGRTGLLSPFDRLVHNRVRLAEHFEFEYVLEMHKPKANVAGAALLLGRGLRVALGEHGQSALLPGVWGGAGGGELGDEPSGDFGATGRQRTGRIITAAALLLVIVVAGFTAGQVVFAKLIGIGTITSIVVDAALGGSDAASRPIRLVCGHHRPESLSHWHDPFRWEGYGSLSKRGMAVAPRHRVRVLPRVLKRGWRRSGSGEFGNAGEVCHDDVGNVD